jgi:hypothetical protein
VNALEQKVEKLTEAVDSIANLLHQLAQEKIAEDTNVLARVLKYRSARLEELAFKVAQQTTELRGLSPIDLTNVDNDFRYSA